MTHNNNNAVAFEISRSYITALNTPEFEYDSDCDEGQIQHERQSLIEMDSDDEECECIEILDSELEEYFNDDGSINTYKILFKFVLNDIVK